MNNDKTINNLIKTHILNIKKYIIYNNLILDQKFLA